MIAVVGSINIDVVVELPRLPRPGETLAGSRIAFYPGGKGANQAVAAARLGAEVSLFGMVGNDAFADRLRRSLRDDRVDTSAVEQVEGTSGMTSIWVGACGENAIAYVPGANARVDSAYVDRHLDAIASADIVLVQLEIPVDTIAHLITSLPRSHPRIILDPAPVADISALPVNRIDIITPNREELRALTGVSDPEVGARRLIAQGWSTVVCTAGADGAYLVTRDAATHFPAVPVTAVDTTAAGDAFNGALAWALARMPVNRAIPWACVAGALAATRAGAQPSLPTRDQLLRLATSVGVAQDWFSSYTDAGVNSNEDWADG